jgi:hypothetical protein
MEVATGQNRWHVRCVVGVVASVALLVSGVASAQENDGSEEETVRQDRDEAQMEKRMRGGRGPETTEASKGAAGSGQDFAQMNKALQSAGVFASLGENNPRLRRILEKLSEEPGIDEVQEAALEFYDLEHGRVKGMTKRAKSKSLLPKVSVEYRRNMIGTQVDKYTYQYDATFDERAGLDDINGQVDEFVVQGSWNLPKLVYNPEVLEVTSLRKLRERVLKEVTRLYYLRRRLKIGMMLDPPEDASRKVRKQIRIDQTTAMINAITNGIYETDERDD